MKAYRNSTSNKILTQSFPLQAIPNNSTPMLKDDDLIIWENHAIIAYLINQYRNDDPLYPNDPKKRSLIDEMMYFDSSVLLTRINNIFVSIKEYLTIAIKKGNTSMTLYFNVRFWEIFINIKI